MDRLADHIADLYELHGCPAAGNMLEEAVRLEEQSLGYPLNLMCSLYYETTPDDPFRTPEDALPPSSGENALPEDHHE